MDTMQPNTNARPGKKFTDLSREVRHRIYELAIYDHDRGVVFLPRAVPRKVMPETDADVKLAYIAESEDREMAKCIAWPQNEGNSRAAGIWVDNQAPDDEADEDDGEGSDSASESEPSLRGPWDSYWGTQEALARDEVLDQVDSRRYCAGEEEVEPCFCECHYHATDDCPQANLENGLGGTDLSISGGGPIAPPETLCDGAGDEGICYCPCHYEPSDDEASDVDNGDESDGEEHDDDEEDDDDEQLFYDPHALYDSKENLGMLYERVEPPLLLVCKQVRTEASLVYYGTNAFSWRFLYLDYTISLEKFKNWVGNIGVDEKKGMKQLTLEGRHSVEEGVEFAADIDLLKASPYFKVKVSCEDLDYATRPLRYALKKDLVYTLWMASGEGSRPLDFSQALLKALGEIFVKGMQRDPIEVDCKESIRTGGSSRGNDV